MPRKRKQSRLYTRSRGGVTRYYADFRDYAGAGGRQEALIAAGEKLATTDRTIAEVLLARRLEELDARRRGRAIHGLVKEASLAQFAAAHLVAKAQAGTVTQSWLERVEVFLRRAIDFMGTERDLASITVEDVRQWTVELQKTDNRHGRNLSAGTVRHHLNALSNLFRRAQAEGYVLPGYNPVAALIDKPTASREEARWLEVHEASLLIEAARTHRTPPEANTNAHLAYPLVATFLLTGARKSEVLGLEAEDVSFDRGTITFRPNEWRRLKTATSHRSVPLWPQLREILQPYIFGADALPGRLLFPSRSAKQEAMIWDFRKLLDAIAHRAGWGPGEIRSKMFRHTYCAARLQTLDRGEPVSEYTVARELGHGGHAMIRRVYAHLGTVRHRSEAVEYRTEQHADRLGERLQAL